MLLTLFVDSFQDTEICSLKDQVEMLQDMLQAKDDAIVKLTNQIFYLESCAATQMTCNDQCLHHDITTDDVLDESRTKETVLLQACLLLTIDIVV